MAVLWGYGMNQVQKLGQIYLECNSVIQGHLDTLETPQGYCQFLDVVVTCHQLLFNFKGTCSQSVSEPAVKPDLTANEQTRIIDLPDVAWFVSHQLGFYQLVCWMKLNFLLAAFITEYNMQITYLDLVHNVLFLLV